MFKNHWYLWTEQRFTHLAIRSTVDATQFLSTASTVRFAVSPAIHCLLVRATLEVTVSWPWLLLVTPFALPVAIAWPEWANQIWEALKCQFHSLCHFQIVQENNLLSYEGLCWQRFFAGVCAVLSLFSYDPTVNCVTIWLINSTFIKRHLESSEWALSPHRWQFMALCPPQDTEFTCAAADSA